MDIREKIGKNVKKFRHKLGISQMELGTKANLHYNYIGKIETAKCNLSIVSLEKLASALNVKIEKLLR